MMSVLTEQTAEESRKLSHPARRRRANHLRITDVEIEGEHEGDQEDPADAVAPGHGFRHSFSRVLDLAACALQLAGMDGNPACSSDSLMCKVPSNAARQVSN